MASLKHIYGVKPQLKVPHVEKMPLFKILQGSGSFMRFKQNQVSSWIVPHNCVFTKGQSHVEARFTQ